MPGDVLSFYLENIPASFLFCELEKQSKPCYIIKIVNSSSINKKE